ncbi:MAG TPA: cytochrome c biogenesis protein CcsA [Aquabacterium sp.]|uniref:cytochrome C assembly family protein n=1 Tax=Aquabacterium sp. TaxID=1872578 RepID=UPI002E2F3B9D|nr:cytochrome c biogenesis protein CcsA [Aquabacterium sp.]HEX5356583.1 cytochrome c biogenesis protein CcsA [Aquabacterium sp.]
MILSPALLTSSTFWPSCLAVLAYVLASAWPLPTTGQGPAHHERPVWAALCLGWLAQAGAIVLDTVAFDGPVWHARFGFAPALSVTTWLVLAVYALENRRLGLPTVRRALAMLAAITVTLAWLFPGQAHATVGSPWAPLHWLTGFASYGLIGAALLHAALLRHAEKQLRAKPASGQIPSPGLPGQALGMPLLRLESLTLRFVGAGFVMLSLTLLLGALFATPWRWDHKTVFSVLSWVVFAVLLIGRARFGWRGRQAVRWLVAGSTLLLLAYVGSRFVLEVVLHRATAA